jgi:hypothetical protein
LTAARTPRMACIRAMQEQLPRSKNLPCRRHPRQAHPAPFFILKLGIAAICCKAYNSGRRFRTKN